MTLAAPVPGPMQTQRRRQIRSEGLVDLLGHLHARISAGDTRRLEYGAAIAPCGHGRATAHRRGRSNAQARSLTAIGVATFAAAPIGGASNIAQPARSQLDLGVAVQRRIECDVVTGWVDVS